MTLKSTVAILALTAFSTITCEAKWIIGTTEYEADTLYHAVVGPGITQTSIALSGTYKQSIHYAEVDLTNPYVTIKTPKGRNTLDGSMTLSEYASTLTKGSERYIMGTNSDFGVYTSSGLIPCGTSVSNNVPYYAFNQGWYGLGFNEAKMPMIDKYIFEGKASTTSGLDATVNGLNTPPLTNQITIFTSTYSSSVTLNQGVTTCKLQNVAGDLAYIGQSVWRVAEISSATTQPLADDYILLCGNGTGASSLANLSVGDELTLDLNPALNYFGKMVEMTGGCPAILKDGQLLDTSGVLDHLTADNPRTAAGYNADRTKFVMMVVDGRSGTARGMTSTQLAQLMSLVGCSDAINLDGGGSSELYSIDRGIVNRPSDGSERKVTNSLWAVSIAPEDHEVASVATESWKIVIPQLAAFTPKIYAYNRYGVLLDLDYKGYTLSTDDGWGTITEDGLTIIANQPGKHELIINYGTEGSTKVNVEVVKSTPQLAYKNITIDNTHTWPIEVVSQIDGNTYTLANSAFTWESSNTSVATVDNDGIITGLANGTVTISSTLNSVQLLLTVTVQIADEYYHNILLDANDWQASGSNISGISLTTVDDGMQVAFTQSSSRGRSLMLKPKNDMPLWAIPDSLILVLGGDAKSLTGVDIKVRNPYERAIALSDANEAGSEYLHFDLAPAASLGIPSYPLILESITLKLPAESRQWIVDLNKLATCYKQFDPDGVDYIVGDPVESLKFVNGSIELPANVKRWEICDFQGRKVMAGNTLTINTASLSAGCYIINVTTCSGSKAYKFVK